jgi:hypothetical protein
MYECGTEFKGWMSDKVLWAVKGQIDSLQELGVHAGINLVGGEPTLNLDRFEHILSQVMRWDVGVEMTTNGWWMNKPSTIRRFMDIVRCYVDPDGHGLETRDGLPFSVRISNDQFHDAFRPEGLQGQRLEWALSNLWERDEDGVFYKTKWYCGECDTYRASEWCPKCEEDCCDIYEEEVCQRPPEPDGDDPWICVESIRSSWRGWATVIPNGRGRIGGHNDVGCRDYSNADSLSYLPNGRLMDVCCKGSWCEFGTVYDDPLLLLELAKTFTERTKPSCSGCRELATEWKKTHLRKERNRIKKEIERMNQEWLEE